MCCSTSGTISFLSLGGLSAIRYGLSTIHATLTVERMSHISKLVVTPVREDRATGPGRLQVGVRFGGRGLAGGLYRRADGASGAIPVFGAMQMGGNGRGLARDFSAIRGLFAALLASSCGAVGGSRRELAVAGADPFDRVANEAEEGEGGHEGDDDD